MNERDTIRLLSDILSACERCCLASQFDVAWTWYGTFTEAWASRFRYDLPREAEGMVEMVVLLHRVQKLLQRSKGDSL